ncbi:hypothetical protein KSF78_0004609 [Schistosoma japonicum]|nr:hypothetical protein KSF78_0004609 [Schistosoma japonicum]
MNSQLSKLLYGSNMYIFVNLGTKHCENGVYAEQRKARDMTFIEIAMQHATVSIDKFPMYDK